MLLRAKASTATGVRNTHTFNLPQPHGDPHHHDIGAQAVEGPDVDAMIILKLSPHQVEKVEG